MYDIDAAVLISEVEKRPTIWNTCYDGYKNKVSKKQAWFEICEALVPKYNELSKEEQASWKNTLLQKWRGIRDNFMRSNKLLKERKLGAPSNRRRKYIYADQLLFLLNNKKPLLRTVSNTEILPMDNGDSMILPEIHTEEISLKQDTSEQELSQNILQEEPQQASASFLQTDEDLAFFYSLLPIVRTLDIDEKLVFRSGTINLLQQLRQKN